MRNPNGYGSVVKLGGKRRKPFGVQITKGFDRNGKQIRKYIGYYETRKEAMYVLSMYNANPYDLDSQDITFLEVLEKYLDTKKGKVSTHREKTVESLTKHLQPLYNLKFKEIKLQNLQLLFNKLAETLSTGSLKGVKSIVTSTYEYAMKTDIADKNIGTYIDLPKHKKVVNRQIFALEEIELLKFEASTNQIARILYVLIYTGFRINELLKMKITDVDLVKRTMKGGSKTEAGQDRIVPIHPKIFEIIQEQVLGNEEYVFENKKHKHVKYQAFYNNFNAYMKMKSMDHTIHDTRHTFATLLTEVSSNKAAITGIIGHTDINMTQHYVHTDVEKMRKEIEKIN